MDRIGVAAASAARTAATRAASTALRFPVLSTTGSSRAAAPVALVGCQSRVGLTGAKLVNE